MGGAGGWLVLTPWPPRQVPPRAFGGDLELEELGIREECGVFRCIASGEWPTQLDVPHRRGQESAGILTSDGSSVPTFKSHEGMGLVCHHRKM
uniref:Uncharacterized protein n=1 Tax=Gorilla gorilla gorilla TaxID=9595 RepID=A0A2I2Z0Q4_GORGO